MPSSPGGQSSPSRWSLRAECHCLTPDRACRRSGRRVSTRGRQLDFFGGIGRTQARLRASSASRIRRAAAPTESSPAMNDAAVAAYARLPGLRSAEPGTLWRRQERERRLAARFVSASSAAGAVGSSEPALGLSALTKPRSRACRSKRGRGGRRQSLVLPRAASEASQGRRA